MSDKVRVDVAMVQRGLTPSREQAQALIMAGQVYRKEVKILKASEKVGESDDLHVKGSSNPYVGRGALKLDKALLDEMLAHQLSERHARALLRLPVELREAALHHIIEEGLTVAKTEAYIDTLLDPKPAKPKRKPLIHIKDIRLFLNTINRSLGIMNRAGVGASCGKEETDDEIVLTITIPKSDA